MTSKMALPVLRFTLRSSRSVEPKSKDVPPPMRRYEPGFSNISANASVAVVTRSPICSSSPASKYPLFPSFRKTLTFPDIKLTPPAFAEMIYLSPAAAVTLGSCPIAVNALNEPSIPTIAASKNFLFICAPVREERFAGIITLFFSISNAKSSRRRRHHGGENNEQPLFPVRNLNSCHGRSDAAPTVWRHSKIRHNVSHRLKLSSDCWKFARSLDSPKRSIWTDRRS